MKKLFISILVLLMLCAPVTALLPAEAAGSAPIAENLELSTYRGVSVGGRFSATDPDGDQLSFEITTEPVKGSIELSEDGRFVYTPESGKRGKDYFGYRATDSEGNRSQEATVIIRIEKQKSKVTYSDLSGAGCAYAAVRLAENGIFTGACLAGSYVFEPNAPVSRAEFLSMCMQATGHAPAETGRSTGFSDDKEIAVWAKSFVSEALRCGIVSGYADEWDTARFDPDRNVSVTEAAVILDRCALLTDAVAAWFSDRDVVPVWARQAAANVSSNGLLPEGCSFSDDVLTRAEAAEMLCSVMDLLQRR